MTLNFTIPTNPKKKMPSLNDVIRAERTQFKTRNGKFMTKGALLKAEWQKYIEVYIRRDIGRNKITNPFVVHYKIYEPDLKRDIGNVFAPLEKYTMDALQIVGTIPNDSQRWYRSFTAEFNIDRSNPRIEVTIEELEDNNGNQD